MERTSSLLHAAFKPAGYSHLDEDVKDAAANTSSISNTDITSQLPVVEDALPVDTSFQRLRRLALRVPELVWSNGLVCNAIAALVISLSVLFVKITNGRVPVLELTLYRSGICFVISIAIMLAKRISPMLGHRKNMYKLAIRGVTGAVTMTTYYMSLMMLPIPDAVTIFFTNPSMTVVLAWVLRGEPLGIRGASGCMLSLTGVVLLSHPPFLFGGTQQWSHTRIVGTVTGVIGAVFCAAGFVSIRYIGKAESALVIALWYHMATVAMSTVPLIAGFPTPAIWPSVTDNLLLVGVAVTSFVGQVLLTRGFQLETAARASAVNFTQVVYSYLFGITIFGDTISPLGICGSLLVALGAMLVNLNLPQLQQLRAWRARQQPLPPPRNADEQRELDGTARLMTGLLSDVPEAVAEMKDSVGLDGSSKMRKAAELELTGDVVSGYPDAAAAAVADELIPVGRMTSRQHSSAAAEEAAREEMHHDDLLLPDWSVDKPVGDGGLEHAFAGGDGPDVAVSEVLLSDRHIATRALVHTGSNVAEVAPERTCT